MSDSLWSNVDEEIQSLKNLECWSVKPVLPQWEDPEDVPFTNTVTNRAGKAAQWIGMFVAKETLSFVSQNPQIDGEN